MNPERGAGRHPEQSKPAPEEKAEQKHVPEAGPGIQPDNRPDPLKEIYSGEQADIVNELAELRDPSKDAVMDAYMSELRRLSTALLETQSDPSDVEDISKNIAQLWEDIEEHRTDRADRIKSLEADLKDMNDFLNPFKGMDEAELEENLKDVTFAGITETEAEKATEDLVEMVTDDMIIGFPDEPNEMIPGARAASTVEASEQREEEAHLPFTPFENRWFAEGDPEYAAQLEEEKPLSKEELVAMLEKNALGKERESSLAHEEEQLVHEIRALLDGNGKIAGVRQIEEFAERKYGVDFDALTLSPKLKLKAAALRIFSPEYRRVEVMYRERVSLLQLKAGLLHDVKFQKKDPRGYMLWQQRRSKRMDDIREKRKGKK